MYIIVFYTGLCIYLDCNIFIDRVIEALSVPYTEMSTRWRINSDNKRIFIVNTVKCIETKK